MEDQNKMTEEENKPIHQSKVAIEEVLCTITAEPGLTIDDALVQANALGYEMRSIDRENNTATIVCYKRKEEV